MVDNSMADTRDFDLNIEKVLEAWDAHHAVRELIANALDEQALCEQATSTAAERSGLDHGPTAKRKRWDGDRAVAASKSVRVRVRDVDITRIGERHWCIRDYGRGLRHTHLTENECAEKLADQQGSVIGRFGFGLKDALAVLHRLGVEVCIASAHCALNLVKRTKAEFGDVVTLHARLGPSPAPEMSGTEIILRGIADADVEMGKRYFLRFCGDEVIEATPYGLVLRKLGVKARVYINGMVVAEEPHYAFSYNITSLTEPMRRSLNRERTNVGRSAYSSRVQDILVAARCDEVKKQLILDLENYNGTMCHDEIKSYVRLKEHACMLRVMASEPAPAPPPPPPLFVKDGIMAEEGDLRPTDPAPQLPPERKPVVFVTSDELIKEKELVDRARLQGMEILQVSRDVAAKLVDMRTASNQPMPLLSTFRAQQAATVVNEFIEEAALGPAERVVWDTRYRVAALVGGIPACVKDIKIAEHCFDPSSAGCFGSSALGLWVSKLGRVIVKRSSLASTSLFAGVLIHELTHASSGHSDVSREFESALTHTIGVLAEKALMPGVGVSDSSELYF